MKNFLIIVTFFLSHFIFAQTDVWKTCEIDNAVFYDICQDGSFDNISITDQDGMAVGFQFSQAGNRIIVDAASLPGTGTYNVTIESCNTYNGTLTVNENCFENEATEECCKTDQDIIDLVYDAIYPTCPNDQDYVLAFVSGALICKPVSDFEELPDCASESPFIAYIVDTGEWTCASYFFADNLSITENDSTTTITYLGTDYILCNICNSAPEDPPVEEIVVVQTPETFIMDSTTCDFQTFDISTNDEYCPGVNYVLTGINDPNDFFVNYLGNGQVQVKPASCDSILILEVSGYFECEDGTQSNEVTDIFVFMPPPIGDIRVNKISDTEQAETGDSVTYTIQVCNVGNGNVSEVTITDDYNEALISYVTDDGGSATAGSTSDNSGIFTWSFEGPILPNTCQSIDVEYVIIGEEGFEYISNIVNASGNDGVNGPNSTTDSDVYIVNELERCIGATFANISDNIFAQLGPDAENVTGSVDISSEFGHPANSLVFNYTNLSTNGTGGTMVTADTTNFTLTGLCSQYVVPRLFHGNFLINNSTDGVLADGGQTWTWTGGTLNADMILSNNHPSYSLMDNSSSNPTNGVSGGQIRWTADGFETAFSAFSNYSGISNYTIAIKSCGCE